MPSRAGGQYCPSCHWEHEARQTLAGPSCHAACVPGAWHGMSGAGCRQRLVRAGEPGKEPVPSTDGKLGTPLTCDARVVRIVGGARVAAKRCGPGRLAIAASGDHGPRLLERNTRKVSRAADHSSHAREAILGCQSCGCVTTGCQSRGGGDDATCTRSSTDPRYPRHAQVCMEVKVGQWTHSRCQCRRASPPRTTVQSPT